MVQRARHRPHDYRDELNSFGFRGPEIEAIKPSGRTRIFFIGASTVFGISCPIEKTFPFLAGEILHAQMPGKDLETVNAARPGTTTPWVLKRLEETKSLLPDIVVVTTGYNDAASVYTNQVHIEDGQQIILTPWYFKLHIFLRGHSMLYTSIKEKLSLLFYKTPRYEFPWSKLIRREANPASREWFQYYPDQYEKQLLKIEDWCKTHQVKLIFIEPPVRPGLEKTQPLYAEAVGALNQKLQEVGRLHHIVVISVQDLFPESVVDKDFLDDVHFTPAGHEKMARAAAKVLEDLLRGPANEAAGI